MKKLYTVITVLAISLAVGVTAMAQGKMAGKWVTKGRLLILQQVRSHS